MYPTFDFASIVDACLLKKKKKKTRKKKKNKHEEADRNFGAEETSQQLEKRAGKLG